MKKFILVLCSVAVVKTQAQNVGIGTTTPNAPLQFGNGIANRKIVLYDVNNNDHQFFGLGLNSGELRYQINEATVGVAHKFFAGLNATTSIELMRIQGNGNVGIGSMNPVLGGLVVDTKVGATNAVFGSNTTGVAIESNYPGIGFNTYWNGSSRKAIANGYGSYIGTDPVNGGMQFYVTNASYAAGSDVVQNTGMVIRPNGNVGIGTAAPNAGLQLGNVVNNRRLVLWEAANNDHQFYGFGITPFTLRYQTPSVSDDHVFYSGSGTSASTELVRIKGNGNVGIGNSTPNGELQFGNTAINRKLVLWETANNDHQFYGLGINGGSLRYQVDNTISAHKFYAGTSATASNELLSINGNGSIGVNGSTGNPGQVLMSNGSNGSAAWISAANVIKTGITENTSLINFTFTDAAPYEFVSDRLTLNITVPSRVIFYYKTRTNANSGNPLGEFVKWRFETYLNGTLSTNYYISGRAGYVLSDNTIDCTNGPDYFDLQPGTYQFSYWGQNMQTSLTVLLTCYFQAAYTIIPL